MVGILDLEVEDDGQNIMPEHDAIEDAEDLEDERTGEDEVEILHDGSVDLDISEAGEPGDAICPSPAGCMDNCCPDCENGWAREIGGCWSSCEEYFNIEMDCSILCPEYTCDSSLLEWLSPGCTGRRDIGFCEGAFGKNSFWYSGPLALHTSWDIPEPTCPLDDPCCHPRECEMGFEVGPDCGGLGFVPFDFSEMPDLGWSCTATNCGANSRPRAGTEVNVHVRWYPSHTYPPQNFILEGICY